MEEHGLGKLLPKSIKSRRRRRKQQLLGAADGDDAPRGRSELSRNNAALAGSDGSNSLHHSDEDEEDDHDDLEEESDQESPSRSRPAPISTHPSQIGYLTTSSPIVQANHLHQVQPTERRPSQPHIDPLSTATTESPNTKPGLSLPAQGSTRSASPVGRFREVFKSKRSSVASGSPSPERRPAQPESEVANATSQLGSGRGSATSLASEPSDTAKEAPLQRFRRLSRGQKIDTTAPPKTPPSGDQGAPVIVNTPPTPTDSGIPRSIPAPREASPDSGKPTATATASSSSPGTMLSQRRGRSGSGSIVPSKLSNITLAPLTPTPENGPTTPGSGGFFNSMLSAAQNATNTLSNTIQNTNIAPWNNSTSKKPVTTVKETDSSQDLNDRIEVEPSAEASSEHSMDSKEPAAKTIGMGDLSLSHLGLAEPNSRAATPTAANHQDSNEARARSESAPAESFATPAPSYKSTDEATPLMNRPQSVYEPARSDDHTTPTGSVYEGKAGIQRTASIRSAIGRHRKRGSSAATGGTNTSLAGAIAAVNSSIANPGANNGPKTTGFAVASKKRNRDFHALFKSVPDDDYLIEDYSCALQREILAHGRLYVSEGHLCFSSNILGWATTLVMSFDEIVSVEKRNTALVFKNGLLISTLHAKHVFASFAGRDATYDLIVKIWKLGHPGLQSSLNGVHIDETGGDKTEKVECDDSIGSQSAGSGSEDESDDGEDVYDEDEDDDDAADSEQHADAAAAETDGEKAVARKASGPMPANGASPDKSKDAPATKDGDDFPGPATHAPTDCGDAASHYDKVVGDDTIAAPLGKVFNLTFGPASVTWMPHWLKEDQKCYDIQMDDTKGLSLENKTRTYSYIKPLSGAIGPSKTKCIVTETIDKYDLENAVNLTCTTQTPDVPSGNVFVTKTKYCFSWAENNATRVQVNCTCEWTGKSWLKGPIENGARDGQTTYAKDLFAGLKAAIAPRARAGAANGVAGAKGKKKGRKGKAPPPTGPSSDSESTKKSPAKQDWGLFEPLRGVLGPVVDIIQPLLTGNVMYGLLVGLLVATWFGFGFTNRQVSRGYGSELGWVNYHERMAAYEEMWRREESELWEWLEERVGTERLMEVKGSAGAGKKESPRTVEDRLREERMDDREVKEAIRVTEEKLRVLKDIVGKKGEVEKEGVKAKAA